MFPSALKNAIGRQTFRCATHTIIVSYARSNSAYAREDSICLISTASFLLYPIKSRILRRDWCRAAGCTSGHTHMTTLGAAWPDRAQRCLLDLERLAVGLSRVGPCRCRTVWYGPRLIVPTRLNFCSASGFGFSPLGTPLTRVNAFQVWQVRFASSGKCMYVLYG
jgi:hypothetical protein